MIKKYEFYYSNDIYNPEEMLYLDISGERTVLWYRELNTYPYNTQWVKWNKSDAEYIKFVGGNEYLFPWKPTERNYILNDICD